MYVFDCCIQSYCLPVSCRVARGNRHVNNDAGKTYLAPSTVKAVSKVNDLN